MPTMTMSDGTSRFSNLARRSSARILEGIQVPTRIERTHNQERCESDQPPPMPAADTHYFLPGFFSRLAHAQWSSYRPTGRTIMVSEGHRRSPSLQFGGYY